MKPTSRISDRTSPDSIKIGGWLFRHRTAVPLPIALALLGLRFGEAPFSWTLTAAGAMLTISGEWLRLWAVHYIGVISRTRSERLGPLIARGPFALLRNPLYLGNIAIWTGFALTARLVWMAPPIAALLFAEYHAIVRWEEHQLEMRHGDDYRAYAARVSRWLPTGSSRERSTFGGTDHLVAFSWRETLFSERGTLVAIGAGFVALWLKAHL